MFNIKYNKTFVSVVKSKTFRHNNGLPNTPLQLHMENNKYGKNNKVWLNCPHVRPNFSMVRLKTI